MSTLDIAENGHLIFEGKVASTILGGDRQVRIYVPGSYQVDPSRHYPVLYVQDGQNAFSTAGPHVAYGWGNWQLDLTVDALVRAGRMQEIIMVAIDCSKERYREYRGPAAELHSPQDGVGQPRARRVRTNDLYERYSRFLRVELKPRIDREYRTVPGARSTGVMGSSMGGLCSLALAWGHPRTFGLVASLSGAFQVERQRFLLRSLQPYTGKRKPIRIYLDSGVIDDGSDDGCQHTEAVAQALRHLGWKDGVHLTHYVDKHLLGEADLAAAGLPPHKWREAQTSQHNEFYWRLRVWRALTFLYPPVSSRR